MRTLASEIEDAVFTLNQKGIWTRLYDVVVDDTTTLYYTENPEEVSYLGNKYKPFPIAVETIEETSKPEARTFRVSFANIDRTLVADIENGKVLGNNVTIRLVFIQE